MELQSFTFNPFAENTFVLYDESKECVIIDPGCYDEREAMLLESFLEDNELIPKYLVNTHCHIDHVFGNRRMADKYGLQLHAHRLEEEVLRSGEKVATMYNMAYDLSPEIAVHLDEGETIEFGSTVLQLIHAPGHSPGSIVFLHEESRTMIGGDVLFFDSIGRTDLPGGHHDTLINSIHDKILTLDDDYQVHCGHGPSTTIGRERRYNPWLRS